MTKVTEIFHLGIVSISVGTFVWATISLVKDYSSGKTGMQTNFIHDHESGFPTLTFCPMNILKDANTDPAQYYEIDDLFNTSLGIFENPKDIRVRKIFYPTLGNCYALQMLFLDQEKAADANFLYINSLQKYSLYIHEPGLEYWIPFTPPIGVSITEIDASQENIKGAQLVIHEKVAGGIEVVPTCR